MTSICMEPPCLVVGINACSEAHDQILASGNFGVSLLRSDQEDLALHFGGRWGPKAFTASIQRPRIKAFSMYRYCRTHFARSNAFCMITRCLAPIPSLSDRIIATDKAVAINLRARFEPYCLTERGLRRCRRESRTMDGLDPWSLPATVIEQSTGLQLFHRLELVLRGPSAPAISALRRSCYAGADRRPPPFGRLGVTWSGQCDLRGCRREGPDQNNYSSPERPSPEGPSS
ncbi:flavin reductase family protein [Bradyrhizobium sp. CB1650]|uniref:flavin reductase family protein n=1 Tax=Bradyrhizobium sp. CB1650 TaxID=3039153 RepID=UPI00325FC6F5